jgi:glycosyltransferase involved in cell wall biosynthesis
MPLSPIDVVCLTIDSNMFGSERSMLDVLSRLDRTRVSPRLIIVRPGPLDAAAREQKIETFLFSWLEGPFLAHGLRAIMATSRLALWLRRQRVKIVELNRLGSFQHLAVMNLAARLAGCKTIVRVRVPGTELTFFQKLTLMGSDRIISVSESSVASWKRNWSKALERRFSVIPDSRDVAQLKRLAKDGALTRSFGIPDRAPIVGMVGAIVANKRQDLFLQAAELILREIPDAWFMIVGSGLTENVRAYMDSLTGFIQGKPLAQRISFTGYRDDALALMKNFDLLIVPSDREAFGGVIIEAMALGVPIVAHRVDGIPEVVEDGVTGTLIERQDPVLYADAAIRLLRDPGESARLSSAASRFVERFESGHITRMVEGIYDELIRQ